MRAVHDFFLTAILPCRQAQITDKTRTPATPLIIEMSEARDPTEERDQQE